MPSHRGRHAPLLGTTVEIMVEARLARRARRVEQQVVAELRRQEDVFNRYSPSSELSRLITAVDEAFDADPNADVVLMPASDDLVTVLALAAEWHSLSGGRFNPMIGRAVDAWRASEELDCPPSPNSLTPVEGVDHGLPYVAANGAVRAERRLVGLNVNGLAKGWILDRAIEQAADANSILINAGGDIARRGRGPLVVNIEDPTRPYDNAAPITTITVQEGGVATSGSSRRPVEIGGARFNHLLDPATGQPVSEVAAASVAAPSTATADILATVLACSPMAEVGNADDVDLLAKFDAGALVVGSDGTIWSNQRWRHLEHASD